MTLWLDKMLPERNEVFRIDAEYKRLVMTVLTLSFPGGKHNSNTGASPHKKDCALFSGWRVAEGILGCARKENFELITYIALLTPVEPRLILTLTSRYYLCF